MSRRLKLPRIEGLDLRGEKLRQRYPFVWTRTALPPYRKGQRCRKVAGRPNERVRHLNGMARVEFTDGARFIVDPRGLHHDA